MKKIGTKLTVRILLMLTVAVLLSSSINYLSSTRTIDRVLGDLCDNSLNILDVTVTNYIPKSKEIAETLGRSDELSKAISLKDSEKIEKIMSELVYENKFDVEYITITDTNGDVIVRSYNDEKGDSILNQSNVSEAIKGNVTTVIAPGTLIKLAVRTGAPAKWNGEVVGVVSVSFPFDDAVILDTLKGISGNEYSIYLNDERINTTLHEGGKRAVGTRLDPKIAKVVLEENEEVVQKTVIFGVKYMAQYKPLMDFDNKAIGIIATAVPIENIRKEQASAITILVFALIGLFIIGTILIISMTKRIISRPIGALTKGITRLSTGMLDIAIDHRSTDELGTLADALRTTISTLKLYVGDISSNLELMASGDMSHEITQDYIGDFVPIKNSLERISDSLNQALASITLAADQVNSGADQVALGAQSLSQGATEQASSIEQLSASIIEVSAQVDENAKNVQIANESIGDADRGIRISNDHMQEMLLAMNEINESSSQIGKIIKVIDDIAFQTNILALNAAVEAARAGSAGKGFAVVADEVRNLASKSADAAKQTTDLIESSVESVKRGTGIAEETALALEEVGKQAGMIVDTIGKINEASNDQAVALRQITQGIDQISAVVQTNSATSEESAAASQELSGQAATLQQEVSQFKLRNVSAKRGIFDDEPDIQPRKIKLDDDFDMPMKPPLRVGKIDLGDDKY